MIYGCSQPRELWFIDFNHVYIPVHRAHCDKVSYIYVGHRVDPEGRGERREEGGREERGGGRRKEGEKRGGGGGEGSVVFK